MSQVAAETLEVADDELQAALFEYLCLYEASLEFTSLKIPGRIAALGPPFVENPDFPGEDKSPILEYCVRHYVLTDTLPGFSAVKSDSSFWGNQVQSILERMAASCLSDSYDKGKVSKRKVLGMACSVFISNVSRGIFGKVTPSEKLAGQDKIEGGKGSRMSDYSAEELRAAWLRWRADVVHKDALKDGLELLEKSTPFDEWKGDAWAATMYVRITLAAILHFIFVESPDSEDTLSILSRVHEKLPYWTIRQTCKIPYATSMVQGLIKVFLAKPMFSRSSLLQSLISSILGSDQAKFEKGIKELEKDSKIELRHREQIEKYVYEASREQQQKLRDRSLTEGISIVCAIIDTTEVDEQEHTQLLKLLELQLSRRDRMELIRILSEDDALPNAIRSFLDFFFPIIAEVHSAVDLPAGIYDMQNFLTDLIEVSSRRANAAEFVQLIVRHESSFIRFTNQLLAKSPKLRQGYTEWYHHCLKAYVGEPAVDLKTLLSKVPTELSEKVREELSGYARYMREKDAESMRRLDAILKGGDSSEPGAADGGFGAWLGVLGDIQADTRVTPRKQKDESFKIAQRKRPNMILTTQYLAKPFRAALQQAVPKRV
ncbi:hypothetical protein PYCC9005_004112 [Savitreella phatthalungensis]